MAYCFAVVTATTRQINAAMLSTQLLALLETIPNHAGREEVHRLRTTVRRLEVQLSDCPRKVARALKTLRREAGKVRDIDVHIALLKPALLPKSSRPAEPDPMEKLREILKAKRDRHLGSLRHLVEDATPLLEVKLPRLAESAAQLAPSAHHVLQLTERARKRFLQWTSNIPDDPERLHRLRIDTKKLRYSLEPLKESQESTELAAKLKQVQDAIGSWHDWATLQQVAERELNPLRTQLDVEPLCSALRERTAREYRKARRAAQIVRNWMTPENPAELTAGGNASQRNTRKAE
jgi:CHAD domain-containing protein